jgi:hypothetical protein
MTVEDNNAICRGSWMLGSACGRCRRCHVEAAELLPEFMRRNKKSARLLEIVATYVPRRSESVEYKDHFKVHLFDELRRAFYEEMDRKEDQSAQTH